MEQPRKVLKKRNGKLVEVWLWAVDYSRQESKNRKSVVKPKPQKKAAGV